MFREIRLFPFVSLVLGVVTQRLFLHTPSSANRVVLESRELTIHLGNSLPIFGDRAERLPLISVSLYHTIFGHHFTPYKPQCRLRNPRHSTPSLHLSVMLSYLPCSATVWPRFRFLYDRSTSSFQQLIAQIAFTENMNIPIEPPATSQCQRLLLLLVELERDRTLQWPSGHLCNLIRPQLYGLAVPDPLMPSELRASTRRRSGTSCLSLRTLERVFLCRSYRMNAHHNVLTKLYLNFGVTLI